jgi:hypothetical protein
MKRRFWNLLAALAGLLTIAIGILWCRSYFVRDSLSRSAPLREITVSSAHGQIRIRWTDYSSVPLSVLPGRENDPGELEPSHERPRDMQVVQTTHDFLVVSYARTIPEPSPFVWTWCGEQRIDISYGLVFALAALIPLHRGYHLLWGRPRPGYCVVCGYNLFATPDHCPECGTRVAVCNADVTRTDRGKP